MSLLNDQALWQGKFFNGQWQAASQSREAVEVATGQVLGAIGYADGRDIATSAQAAKAVNTKPSRSEGKNNCVSIPSSPTIRLNKHDHSAMDLNETGD